MSLNRTNAWRILNVGTAANFNRREAQPQWVNQTLVTEVLRAISELYELNTFVLFMSERLAGDNAFAAIFVAHFMAAFPSLPLILITSMPSKMSGFLSSSTMAVILTTEEHDPIMEVAALSMHGCRFIKTIFIFYPVLSVSLLFEGFQYNRLYGKVHLLYEWIWREQFLNTILMTIRNQIYTHDPYPTASIVDRSANWTVADFFKDYSADLKGYQIRSAVHHDFPRVFPMSRHRLDPRQVTLSGVTGKMFLTFLQVINATLKHTLATGHSLQPLNMKEVVNAVESKHLEMGINSYTDMIPSLVGASYPMGINDFCIMVPYQNSTPERLYIQAALRAPSWYLLIFTLFYITLGIWLCTPSSERDLSLSFLQSICSLTLTTPLRFITLPYGRLRYLFIILFLIGFFITNLYVSKLASFFIVPTPQQQIDTVEDVIRAKLPIMMMDFEYENVRRHNFSPTFLDLIVVASKAEMDQHRDHFNSSFGYSVQTDHWSFLNKQQAYLHKPLFRTSSICIGSYYHVFPIQRDSHLAQALQKFILSASQYGLGMHWREEAFLDALFMGYSSIIIIDLPPLPLSMMYFRAVWFVWWLGVCLGKQRTNLTFSW